MILSYMRTILLYLVLITVVRLMGKRQIGQMEPSEFVVTMLIANLAAIPMQDGGIPLLSGLVPILAVLGLEWTLAALSMRSVFFRRLLCGKPVILIDNGRLLERNLRRTRVNLDELSGHLREQGILEIETVQFAILETNGTITVFPYPHFQPATAKDAGIQASRQELPYTIISDSRVLHKNLVLAGKDSAWLDGYLSSQGCPLSQVLLMTLTPGGKPCLIRRQSPEIGSESQI